MAPTLSLYETQYVGIIPPKAFEYQQRFHTEIYSVKMTDFIFFAVNWFITLEYFILGIDKIARTVEPIRSHW